MNLPQGINHNTSGKDGKDRYHLQPTMPATKSAHTLSLNAGHSEEVLRVGKVVRELSELLMQLRLEKGGRRELENQKSIPQFLQINETGLGTY